MSSKSSLIMQLYEQAMGHPQEHHPDGTRLVTSTKTLLNHAIPTEKIEKKEFPDDVALESKDYEAIINQQKRLVVTTRKNIVPGDQIRILETKGLSPTGRSMMKTALDVIVGTGENGVSAGMMVLVV